MALVERNLGLWNETGDRVGCGIVWGQGYGDRDMWYNGIWEKRKRRISPQRLGRSRSNSNGQATAAGRYQGLNLGLIGRVLVAWCCIVVVVKRNCMVGKGVTS
jgi:hypothetical protein